MLRNSIHSSEARNWFVLVVAVLAILSSINLSNAEATTELLPPSFSATISINKKDVYAGERLHVTVTVVGIGHYSTATLVVVSDTLNIVLSTYWIQHHLVTEKLGHQPGPKIPAHADDKDKKVVYVSLGMSGVKIPKDDPIVIQYVNGGLDIDTSGMSPGSYRLRAVFSIVCGDASYVFQDSAEYRVMGLYEFYPTLQYLVPALISIPTSVLASVLIAEYRMKRRLEQPIQSRKRR